MKDRLLIPLWALVVVKAIIYVVLVPPWLGPDEALRFEYVRLFSKTGLRTWTPISSVENQQEILESMSTFGAWRFLDMPEPTGAGLHQMSLSPLGKDTPSTTYPPLYYLLVGNFLRILGIERPIPQLYTGRLLSVFLGALQLYLLLKITELVWPTDGRRIAACSLAFMAFLPQWSYLGAVVHPDNWSNLLAAFILWLFLGLTSRTRLRGETMPALRSGARSVILRGMLLVTFIVLMSLSTRATAILLASLSLAFALRLVRRPRPWRAKYLGKALLTAGIVVAIVVTGWLLVREGNIIPEGLSESVARGLMLRGGEIPTDVGGTLISRFDRVTWTGMARSLLILFTTFWLALGTLVYKLSMGWCLLLGALSGICALGLLRRPRLTELPSFDQVWLVLLLAPLVTLAAVFYVYGPHQSLAPEGRYLLLFLPAIAILMAEGWRRVVPPKSWRLAAEMWMSGWIFLNLVVIFKYIIPRYYL